MSGGKRAVDVLAQAAKAERSSSADDGRTLTVAEAVTRRLWDDRTLDLPRPVELPALAACLGPASSPSISSSSSSAPAAPLSSSSSSPPPSRLEAFVARGWASVPIDVDPGSALPERRRRRKRQQVASMLRCCLPLMAVVVDTLSSDSDGESPVVIDFCGGGGHLGLVLAYLRPAWRVIVLDTNAFALGLCQDRARKAGLANLSTAQCDVRRQDLIPRFDLGVAVHACGPATDAVLRVCGARRVPFVACPCCIGKLAGKYAAPGLATHAAPAATATADTSSAEVAVLPVAARSGAQSSALRSRLSADEFAQVARLADDSSHASAGGNGKGKDSGDVGGDDEAAGDEVGQPMRDWSREEWTAGRCAKRLVEADRLMAAQESHAMAVRLTHIQPRSATPKHDILVGWPLNWPARPAPAGATGTCTPAALRVFDKPMASCMVAAAPVLAVQGAPPDRRRGELTALDGFSAEQVGAVRAELERWLADTAAATTVAGNVSEAAAAAATAAACYYWPSDAPGLVIPGLQVQAAGGGRGGGHSYGQQGPRSRKLFHVVAHALGLAHRSEGRGAARRVVISRPSAAAASVSAASELECE